MKKKVLIIFKYAHQWNLNVIDKFSNYYDTEFLYISNFKNRNFTETVNDINNLIKAIFQLKIIFTIIKNSSFLIKLLIVSESVINTFWYSIIYTLKSKK